MFTTHRCWVYGDSVNTDVIFPGRYTYTVTAPDEIAAHALEDLDGTFAKSVQPGDVIVAGRNWGCGSSREQAVSALKYAGVGVIVAASFSRIYFRNCINQGVLPVVCPGLVEIVHTGDTIQIDRDAGQIVANGQTFTIPRLSPSVQAILDAGGLVPMLQRRFKTPPAPQGAG
jgi:3-isopropylmalate/(R)-2-methylmalate dehydratase small subunit